jgi:tRNA modification GTPase
MNLEETIVAIATPPGRGGLGVVRLSGPCASAIARSILRSPGGNELPLESWRIHIADLPDESGALIDRVLISYFAKPRSYTGEDVVELSCHGSPVILRHLLERCLLAGARLAEPGEFTMRAFLNGRMDLAQAEAVRDLIDARTLYQARVAAQQMQGAVSHWVAPWKKDLVDLIALLEAGIDFAEDDVGGLSAKDISARLGPVTQGLEKLAESFRTGKIVLQGLTLAIVGRPNVGKSSLFNCLVRQDRAIVTAAPGTTRDLVSETVEIEGVSLRFVDTAGIRQAYDEAESIGIRKSFEAAAESDLTIVVLDGSLSLSAEDRHLLEKLDPQQNLVVVINKSDLPAQLSWEDLRGTLKCASEARSVPILSISALRGEGIESLRKAIIEAALPSLAGDREPQFLTHFRHEQLIRQALGALHSARAAAAQDIPHEMLLLDLYSALRPLNAVTGETTVEDILAQIFSTFCIGK